MPAIGGVQCKDEEPVGGTRYRPKESAAKAVPDQSARGFTQHERHKEPAAQSRKPRPGPQQETGAAPPKKRIAKQAQKAQGRKRIETPSSLLETVSTDFGGLSAEKAAYK